MLTMLLVGTSNAFGVENQRFRIYIQEDGVYRISYAAVGGGRVVRQARQSRLDA